MAVEESLSPPLSPLLTPPPYLRPTVVRNHEQRPELVRQAGRQAWGYGSKRQSWRTKAALIPKH